uniref:Uncharacterized protein n=1 Tax=Trypanosoma vivax (strain Y486) TaxID=1055687 RepID=G0TU71_TRYVY|nr:hypothetical protein TVY486_0401710 [Trypanosoma vivax Y486]
MRPACSAGGTFAQSTLWNVWMFMRSGRELCLVKGFNTCVNPLNCSSTNIPLGCAFALPLIPVWAIQEVKCCRVTCHWSGWLTASTLARLFVLWCTGKPIFPISCNLPSEDVLGVLKFFP